MSGSEQLISSQTSSIGAVWPPVETTHNRVRGFYTDSIVTNTNVGAFAAQFTEQRERLETLGSDRLTIRVVAHAGALATLDAMGVAVEAAIPLANTPADNLVIAYTGHNKPNRSLDATTYVSLHHELLSRAVRRQSIAEPAEMLGVHGFTQHIVDPTKAETLGPRFQELYAAFGYDEEDVVELLGNSNNTIAYVEDNDLVISTAMAESGTVEIAGLGATNIVEITEASTHPDYRGHGLYKAISGLLVQGLLEQRGHEISALYGESNLAMPGVVYAAGENGRRFSHFDRATYGIIDPAFGILPQNFHVGDGAEQRPYNDFAVSYVPLG
ncbi:MAG TPA: hypothetical protein VLH38_02875 [Patescibacteria group bacterium]|nr:hypothetical protein [Patescibacteria group bacterium]